MKCSQETREMIAEIIKSKPIECKGDFLSIYEVLYVADEIDASPAWFADYEAENKRGNEGFVGHK